MPQVRKRRCQTLSMSLSTVALTTALSKLSEISRTERTTMIHSICAVPETVPVLYMPYHGAEPQADEGEDERETIMLEHARFRLPGGRSKCPSAASPRTAPVELTKR